MVSNLWQEWTWDGSLRIGRVWGKTCRRNDYSVCDADSCVLREYRQMAACKLNGGLLMESKQSNECRLYGWLLEESEQVVRAGSQCRTLVFMSRRLWKSYYHPQGFKVMEDHLSHGPMAGLALLNVLTSMILTSPHTLHHLHTPSLLMCARNCRKPFPLVVSLQLPQLKSLILCSL